MEANDSFKQPGAIPFKWELRPGVPKLQHSHEPIEPSLDQHRPITKADKPEKNQSRSCPETPRKLRPPPAGFSFQSPIVEEPRARSFRSAPRLRSESVASDRCFLSPLLRRVKEKKKKKCKTGPEPDYMSDLETVSRWSVSSRKSLSPFHDSLSSSFSSVESTPRRPVSDADWAGFGLF